MESFDDVIVCILIWKGHVFCAAFWEDINYKQWAVSKKKKNIGFKYDKKNSYSHLLLCKQCHVYFPTNLFAVETPDQNPGNVINYCWKLNNLKSITVAVGSRLRCYPVVADHNFAGDSGLVVASGWASGRNGGRMRKTKWPSWENVSCRGAWYWMTERGNDKA